MPRGPSMVGRYVLLAILCSSLLIIPFPLSKLSVESNLDRIHVPFISPRLQSELSMDTGDCQALFQFDRELTPLEIRFAESNGIQFVRRGSSVVHVGRIYSGLISDASIIQNLQKIGFVKATSGTKRFFPSISTSVQTIGAPDVWSTIRKNGNAVNGSGSTVAVIDTGATWQHPTFWRQTTGEIAVLEPTPGQFYADLDGDSQADANEGPIVHVDINDPSKINTFNEYLYIDANNDGAFNLNKGDQWLAGVDANSDGEITLSNENVVVLGEPKVAVLYDQYYGYVFYRGINLTSFALATGDSNGHGTHVASTIAGGQPGLTSMVGVAPGADLIIIKSPLKSSDIIDAIHFAIAHDADVINMSFSSYLGFLDGTDLEDLAISEAFRKNGTICSLAAGNLAGRSKHARFQVESSSTESASLSVSNPSLYSFINILWHSSDRDEHVILTPPMGEDIDLGTFSDLAGGAWALNKSSIQAYVFAEISLRGLNSMLIQVSEDEHRWESGIWNVTIQNPSGPPIWIDAYAWDNNWDGSQLRFTNRLSNSYTISSPGTSDLGVSVANSDKFGGSLSSSSSKGPRVDGIAKPTITAPGVGIVAAHNSLTNLWRTRSGTSMAAPHIAGAIALLRQVSEDSGGWVDYTALIEGAGGNSSHYSPALVDWGHGLCDALHSIIHADRNGSRPIVESLSLSGQLGVYEVEIAISDNDTSIQQLDIAWNIVEGDLQVLDSGSQEGSTSARVTVDLSLEPDSYLRSIIFNISDGEHVLTLPPIMLSGAIGVDLQITSAALDRDFVAVGPFIQEHITGRIVVDGYALADTVTVAFCSDIELWLNFTLEGVDGVYEIDIFPSGFSPGEHEVYAVIESRLNGLKELKFATLTIVHDNSIIVIIGVSIIAVIVGILILKRYRRDRT